MATTLQSRFFPPVEKASGIGLLCVGGQLTTPMLLDAYRHGIFPWPVFDDQHLLAWWSPNPRAILEFDGLHISRRLRRTCRSGKFEVTCDLDFAGVMHGCATAQDRRRNTWITTEMTDAYCKLHDEGIAHSVEVWRDGALVGGIYGVAIGGLFAGESMFYRERDASKVALVHLVAHLKARGYTLFDLQEINPHTARLGAIEISREEYLQRMQQVIDQPIRFGEELTGDIAQLL